MKSLFTAITLAACLVFSASPGEAKAHHHYASPQTSGSSCGWGGGGPPLTKARAGGAFVGSQGGRHPIRVGRHFSVATSLPQDCLIPISKGGPCGCWAARHF